MMIENIITLVLLNKLFRCVDMYELLLRLCMTGICLIKKRIVASSIIHVL